MYPLLKSFVAMLVVAFATTFVAGQESAVQESRAASVLKDIGNHQADTSKSGDVLPSVMESKRITPGLETVQPFLDEHESTTAKVGRTFSDFVLSVKDCRLDGHVWRVLATLALAGFLLNKLRKQLN